MAFIHILVVDDCADWRNKVRSLLRERPEWQIIGEASDGPEALEKGGELRPDIIVLDIGLPKLNGIEAARRIRQLSPNSKIIFLSMENSLDVVQAALSTGGLGYVCKADAHSDLLLAIDAVLGGKQFISSSLKDYKFTDIPLAKAPHGHELLFFSNETVLLDSFTSFIAAALKAGNAAIVLVTKSHHEMLRQRLKTEHVDADSAIRQGTYISLDLADTLATLLVDGLPDPVRFFEDFSALIDTASKASEAEHPWVAFCGECLGHLWAEGKTNTVIQLEQACNNLAKRHDVDMLCAYSSSSLHGDQEHLKASMRNTLPCIRREMVNQNFHIKPCPKRQNSR